MTKRVGILVGLISIATSPWTTYDPINPLKFVLLGITGMSCFVYLILTRKRVKLDKLLIVFSTVFLSQALVSLFFSGSSLTEGFFGHYGRYFGIFSWSMLFMLLLFISIAEKAEFILKVFFYTGGLSFLYSILQYFGKDPAPWDNYFNEIVGFLGNPNFQSSFLGLFFTAICGSALQNYRNFKYILFLMPSALLTMTLILTSSSIQGIFVAAIGVLTYLVYFLFSSRYYKIFWSLVILGSFIISFTMAAVIGLGPLANYLHKGTLALRGDYWLAALSMAKANLFTGVGPDQYGTWYRFYRHGESLTRINANVTSDSAHNGYLDFAANLGILSLVTYLLLLGYALFRIMKFIEAQVTMDYTHATLVALFVGFQAQFLISPNQIGLVIWGWVFLGAIFGYKKLEVTSSIGAGKQRPISTPLRENENLFTAPLFVGTLIGGLLAGPIIFSSMQYRSALLKADAIQIIAAANNWPRSAEVLNYTATILFSNNLQEQGNELIVSGIREFPNSYDLWHNKMNYRWITDNEKSEIRAQLHRLDPLNPEWVPKG